jgi:hypothetical protein
METEDAPLGRGRRASGVEKQWGVREVRKGVADGVTWVAQMVAESQAGKSLEQPV